MHATIATPSSASSSKTPWKQSVKCYDVELDSDSDSDLHLEEKDYEEPLFLSSPTPRRQKELPTWRIPSVVWIAATCLLLVSSISLNIFLLVSPAGGSGPSLSVPNAQVNETIEDVSSIEDTSSENKEDLENEDRPLILYAYHETDNAHQNAEFFIAHGLHAQADFIFVLNGETNLSQIIPAAPNIKIVQRDNTCFDLGSHAEVLTKNDSALVHKYNKFILMNASIRGPFLPTWSRECWSDAYLDKVTETNKLVGMSFNCIDPPHIQSMIFATDRIGLKLLLTEISTCFSKIQSAMEAETHSTGAVQAGGYNVTAFMTAFSSDKDYAHTCTHEDILYDGAYYGGTLHPYEGMFQKANRDLAPQQLEMLTKWHRQSGYSSWDACWKSRNVRKAIKFLKKRGSTVDYGV
ncbi:hypothetical protein TWF718_000244 [Orbilia javanica]|uniref:Uncharacterized protein n=1 Tax=Orbilia javanica TaxID=47235 RepID=A0AAN8N7R0_9PEZI